MYDVHFISCIVSFARIPSHTKYIPTSKEWCVFSDDLILDEKCETKMNNVWVEMEKKNWVLFLCTVNCYNYYKLALFDTTKKCVLPIKYFRFNHNIKSVRCSPYKYLFIWNERPFLRLPFSLCVRIIIITKLQTQIPQSVCGQSYWYKIIR